MIAAKTPTAPDQYHVSTDSINYDDRTQVINHYDTFCIFDRWGDIHSYGKKAQGIFYKGTRFLNQLQLRLNRIKPLLLSSSIKQDNEILSVDLTNPDLVECNILENTLHIGRKQFIRNGIYYEEIKLVNYGESACTFHLSLSFDADFSDIFEIRGMNRKVKSPKTDLHFTDKKIVFSYTGLDGIHRRTDILFKEDDTCTIQHNTCTFAVTLSHQQSHTLEYVIYFQEQENPADFSDNTFPDFAGVRNGIQKDIQKTRALFASVSSSNERFNNWIVRSMADLQSLLARTSHGIYPFAGVPWYNTAFGRDGIITAMEVLWLAPDIAKDALYFLASTQSHEMNAEKDAEPGKIIHEMRTSEMANTGEVPFKQYYGTIDATPLFLMLAGMYYYQTADKKTIQAIWNNIKDAINWINVYGDIDGDGFVEYKNKSENGLTNQGWKDSFDSIMYANGVLCEPPIALCEVQGYVYAAKKYTAMLARAIGEKEYAAKLDKEADELQKKFDEQFWDEELGAFVLALDGHKKPCKVLASNAGHCLFTGIAIPSRAGKLAKQLTGKEMFSGWGIRTLGCQEVRYNPMSYHDGSIWPHDNAIIAYGLGKYGFHQEALKVMQGLFDASLYIDLQRLPELFCGFERRPNEGPTAYPVACSPQAWAVGAVFLLLQACLQIEINALDKTVTFNQPQLPDYLEKISVTNLKLGNGYCHFEIYRHKYDVSFHLVHKPDDWSLTIKK